MRNLGGDVAEVKTLLSDLNKRDFEDSGAFAKDILRLQQDVEGLNLKHTS